jgi:DNA-binding CsgD family transcriptional regulator/pimeloyl-ACP methyl ester carboxylesterase
MGLSNAAEEWDDPVLRAFYTGLVDSGRRVVSYDARGSANSDRSVTDLSLDAHVADLIAVVGSVSAGPVDVLAALMASPVACAFAARHHAALKSLIIVNGHGHLTDLGEIVTENCKTREFLAERDFLAYATVNASRMLPDDPVAASRVARRIVSAVTAAEFARIAAGMWTFDIRAELQNIGAPTMIACTQTNRFYPAAAGRRLAANIPGAEFHVLPGPNTEPAHIPGLVEVVTSFLDRHSEAHPSSAPGVGQVIDSDVPVPATAAGAPRLSPREREVLALLADGQTEREIASSLCISPATASRHVANLYAKLGVHRRAEAVAWAIRNGVGS